MKSAGNISAVAAYSNGAAGGAQYPTDTIFTLQAECIPFVKSI
jgi:hypothetical protein